MITASLSARGGATLDAQRLSASVDGVPRESELLAPPAAPLSVVLAIETSSSMSATRLAAAQALALEVIDGLSTGDRVAVVSFGDEAATVQPFTANVDAARAAVSALETTRWGALRDAVMLSSELLAAAPTGPRALVVLTYGWDFGNATVSKAESLAAARASGAAAYAVALGKDYDSAYLEELASTGGAFWATADEAALPAALGALRRKAAGDATYTLRLTVPPLARGEHTLTVRSSADSGAVEASFTFSANNAGLIAAELADSPDGGAPLVVRVSSPASLAALTVEATAGGHALPVDPATGRVTLDPWAFDPGPLEVTFTALVEGELAATATAPVQVPRLSPELAIALDDPETPSEALITARAQGATPWTLTVTVDGVEAARTADREARVPVTAGSEVVARLESADGVVLATGSVSAPAPAVVPAATPEVTAARPAWLQPPLLPAGAAAAAIALAVAYILVRSRSSHGNEPRDPDGPHDVDEPRRGPVAMLRRRPRLHREPEWTGSGPITEGHLRRALEEQQFVLHYQPVVSASGGALVALEALVRWQQPSGRVVPPARFMPVAEISGLIIPLGDYVMRSACAFVRAMQQSQNPGLRVAVNLARAELLDRTLESRVRRALEVAELAPEFLELEVAERAAALDLDGSALALARLRALGVGTVLDDFGLGAESRRHLRRLGVDAVKIDLWAATRNEVARSAVLEAVKLAQSLGVTVTAKRVETQEELEFFRTLGTSYVQGYAFGEPALPSPITGGGGDDGDAESTVSGAA